MAFLEEQRKEYAYFEKQQKIRKEKEKNDGNGGQESKSSSVRGKIGRMVFTIVRREELTGEPASQPPGRQMITRGTHLTGCVVSRHTVLLLHNLSSYKGPIYHSKGR